MICDDLPSLLHEAISDETAYVLSNLLMDLALMVESHYYSKIKRHSDNASQPEEPYFLRQDE